MYTGNLKDNFSVGTMSSNILFPAPVGGVPLAHDLAPAVFFACLNGVLVIVAIARFCKKETRTAVVIRMFGFVVDRTTLYSLRAAHARRDPASATGRNLTIYMQITLATGYLTMLANITILLRCLIVGTTHGESSVRGSSIDGDVDISTSTLTLVEDQPRRRFWYRRLFDFTLVVGLLPAGFGVFMGTNYPKAITDAEEGVGVQYIRYIVAILSLVIIGYLQLLAAWALFALRRVNHFAIIYLLVVTLIISIVPIYHLVAMRTWTTSLLSTATGSQNTAGEKAAFYALQATPELLAATLLTCANVKKMFGTGSWGDRWTDKKVEAQNT